MTKIAVAAFIATLLAGAAAQADSFETLSAAGTFSNGSALSGALTIDTTIGSVVSDSLTSSDLGNLLSTPIAGQGYSSTYGAYDVSFSSPTSSSYGVILLIDAGTLVGYSGGVLDSLEQPSANNYVSALYEAGTPGVYSLSSGTLTTDSVASDTPEPSTWVFMVGGVGLMGLRLRRLRAIGAHVTL